MKTASVSTGYHNNAPHRLLFECTRRTVWGLFVWSAVMIGLINTTQAAVFNVASGDVIGLIDAINQSNANGEADTIQLESGVYSLVAVDNLTDGANGLPSIMSAIEITGAGIGATIIERAVLDVKFRILHIGQTAELTLSDLTIEKGHILEASGGGLLNRGTTELNRVRVGQNEANWFEPLAEVSGGGIFNLEGELNLNEVTIDSNTVFAGLTFNALGGGISNSGKMNLMNVTINNNLSTGGGGGIYNKGGVMNLRQVTIRENITESGSQSLGGGILNNEDGLMTLKIVTISGNPAGNGGGILNSGTMTLTEVAVSGNTAEDFAGGISNDGAMVLDRVTISENQQKRSSGEGGGVINYDQMSMINTTISGNSGAISGGGILNSGDLGLASVTIAANTVSGGTFNNPEGHGCAVTNTGAMVVTGSVVAACSPADACAGAIVSEGYNLDQDGSCGFTDASDLSGMDPMLGPLQGNGGYTQTHALLSGSPAIDTGDDINYPATDQRNTERPQDGDADSVAVADIGAYEYDSPDPTYAQQCSTLGDNRLQQFPDLDMFTIEVRRQETITVGLAADPSGDASGLDAKMVLVCRAKRSVWVWRNTGPMPLRFEQTIPAAASCRIILIQKKWDTDGFQGEYCLTLTSSDDAWQTLTATGWVE